MYQLGNALGGAAWVGFSAGSVSKQNLSDLISICNVHFWYFQICFWLKGLGRHLHHHHRKLDYAGGGRCCWCHIHKYFAIAAGAINIVVSQLRYLWLTSAGSTRFTDIDKLNKFLQVLVSLYLLLATLTSIRLSSTWWAPRISRIFYCLLAVWSLSQWTCNYTFLHAKSSILLAHLLIVLRSRAKAWPIHGHRQVRLYCSAYICIFLLVYESSKLTCISSALITIFCCFKGGYNGGVINPGVMIVQVTQNFHSFFLFFFHFCCFVFMLLLFSSVW